MLEVLEADRNELDHLLLDSGVDQDGGAVRECLHLVLEDAAEDLRAGALAAWCRSDRVGPATTRLRE